MTFGASRPSGTVRPPQRSRVRTVIPLAVAAWAVLEIWLLTLVAEAAGGLTVLALLVAGVVLGVIVVKRAGRKAWRGLAQQLQPDGQGDGRGERPTAEGGSGNGLTMLAGLLLIVPGLISDGAALLCLFPPTRALIRKASARWLARRGGAAPGPLGDAFQQARIHRPDGKVVQGEVIRDDEPPAQHRDDPQLPR